MDFRRTIFCFIAALTLVSVAGCSGSPEPQFAATYSAIGAQVK
jgi:hypothetical protein